MRLDEQLPDRGPGAPVRPGGGSWLPALIVVAVIVASGGIFLAGQMQMQEAISDYLDMKRQAGKAARAKEENDVPPVARARGAERAEAIGSPAEWVRDDDYPPGALNNGEQGAVGIEFVIARNGRVSGCTVVQSSGSQLLDRKTCQLVTERALYSPAVDAQRRAVEQTSRLRFRWQIAE